jgi:hypothetical protein
MRKLMALLAIAAATLNAYPASAGVYTDDLSKCLVRSSNADDQIVLMQWMFGVLALAPAVQPFSSITPTQRETLNRKGADLFVRLLSDDCRQQSIDGIKYEGLMAVQGGFQVLGQVAARGLTTDPHVSEGMKSLSNYASSIEKLKELLIAAGVVPPPNPNETK